MGGEIVEKDNIPITINGTDHKAGTYKGRPYKCDAELDAIADSIVTLLRTEGLTIWQAKEVLRKASRLIDWEIMK